MGIAARLVMLLAGCLLFLQAPTLAAGQEKDTYTFGVVPQFEAERIHVIWRPILNKLEQLSGVKLKLVGSPDIPRFEKQFMSAGFDFAYMNPYHLVKANNAHGCLPLVRDVGEELHGIIVVRKDSPVKDIHDLNGSRIAFPSPNALGASLLPRAILEKQYNISFQPLYVQTHSSVYLNVVLGISDAGGGVQKSLLQQPDEIKNNLRILYKTPAFAPHPVVAHPRVPAMVRRKVQDSFLALGQTEDGRLLLARVPIGKIGVASEDDYSVLEDLDLDPLYISE